MRIYIIVFLIIGPFLFLSCKEDKSQQSIQKQDSKEHRENEELQNKNVFSVKLNVLLRQDDALEVFYMENEADGYIAERMVQKKLNGSDKFQEVIFDFPENVYPYNIRLDFGFVKAQEPIQIYDCTLIYNNNSFVIKGGELVKYFRFNGGIEMQSDSLTFVLKPFNLHGKEVHDPYIIGNKNLETALMTKL